MLTTSSGSPPTTPDAVQTARTCGPRRRALGGASYPGRLRLRPQPWGRNYRQSFPQVPPSWAAGWGKSPNSGRPHRSRWPPAPSPTGRASQRVPQRPGLSFPICATGSRHPGKSSRNESNPAARGTSWPGPHCRPAPPRRPPRQHDQGRPQRPPPARPATTHG